MMNYQNTAGCTCNHNDMDNNCMGNHNGMDTNNCMGNHNGMDSSYMNNHNSMMNHARMNGNQMNPKELGEWVSMLGFCAYDMLLYMDTHPDDQNALDYFNQCTELYNAAKKTYEERCRQLNAFSGGPLSSWDWNTAPMPWEGGR